jgi:hypothetical protein
MIHTKGNKNKMFFELMPESIEFGDASFNVYSNVIKILDDYRKDF